MCIHHLLNLLSRSWAALIGYLGTTTFGLFTTLLGIIFASTLLVVVIGCRKGRTEAKNHIKTWFSLRVGITIISYLILYLAIYSIALINTIYDDHMSLVKALAAYNRANKTDSSKNNVLAKVAPNRNFTATDKGKLDLALSELSDILNTTGVDALRKAEEFAQKWEYEYQWAKNGKKPTIAELHTLLDGLKLLTENLNRSLSKEDGLQRKYVSYEQELNMILTPHFESESFDVTVLKNFQNQEDDLSHALDNIDKLQDWSAANMMVYVSESKFKEFKENTNYLQQWINGVKRNIEDFKPYIQ